MYALRLPIDADTSTFREAAKRALSNDLRPGDVAFVSHDTGIFFDEAPPAKPLDLTVPRAFAELMDSAICHRREDRFALLYDVLWRLKHGEPALMERATDPAIAKLGLYAKAARHDIHKMHAFVRFHKQETKDGELYLAWFEPEHFILKAATPFFAKRFANMRWIIATPIGTAVWDTQKLTFEPARPKPEKLEDDVLDGLWRTYYRTIFNPARLNRDAMTKEMPRRYWKNMPEAADIPAMMAGAANRLAAMDRDADIASRFADKARPQPQPDMPKAGLTKLRAEAEHCTACPLYKHATQTVFGEGPARARFVLVGEQPGDQEDLAGKPFVGPAGQLLDRALKDAGIDRDTVYITNAVKHFKFEPRGKRRIHSKPNASEVNICSTTWLARELATIAPEFVVALGGTAAQALSGKGVAITKLRGHELEWADGRRGLATVHPSYLLRLPDPESKDAEYKKFVADLKLATKLAAHPAKHPREAALL
ncbi:MAG TPA: UdgX family uracil-DNA binding protein [Rhizomicrobium sp.]|nr:UdgX family uracil-DNA binding protein [Rhizomicrobium sp.]